MMDAAKRSKHPGYSKTGQKLRRRSRQGKKDGDADGPSVVLMGVLTAAVVLIMALVWWWLVKDQAESAQEGLPSGGGSVPTISN